MYAQASPRRAPGARYLWAALLALAAVLLPLTGAIRPARAQSAGPGVTAWKVSWVIEARGTHAESNDGGTSSTRRSTRLSGEATITHLPDGSTQIGPYQLNVSDDLYAVFRHFDERNSFAINQFSIVDGGSYSSGLQPPLLTSSPFSPEQDDDGSYSMSADPFTDPLFGMLGSGEFTYRTHLTTHLGSTVLETKQSYYTQVLLNQVTASKEIERIPGDPTGRYYQLDEQFTVTPESGGMGNDMENMPVHIRVSVRPANECDKLGSPIEASNPNLSLMRDSIRLTLTPDEPFIPFDGETSVKARLTCDGVPIRGAQLQLGADVVARSGFHGHHDPSRPRGWIESVRVTPANYLNVVQRATDDKGEIEFLYMPGADTQSDQSDISGTYRLRGFAPDFGAETWVNIDAKVPGLVELPQTGEGYEAIGETFEHRQNHYGTPATLAAVPAMVESFRKLQNDMNDARIRKGKETLPVMGAVFGDISLPWGGHFDTSSLRERSVFWRPPHTDHDMGEEVSFIPGAYLYRLVEAGLTLPEAELASGTMDIMLQVSVGRFGTWVGSDPPSLRVRQSTSPQSTDLAAGASPAVAATLIGRGLALNPVAAPGQAVRIGIGYHNLDGGAPATGATLTATLPEGLRYVGADMAPQAVSGRTITWSLGDLPAGALPEMILLDTAVEAGAAVGATLPVSIQLSAAADTTSADNQARVDVAVRPLAPDLLVTSTIEGAPLAVGQTTSFQVTVTNRGTAPAISPALSVALPAGTALVSSAPTHTGMADARTYRWALPALAPNETRTVELGVALDPLLATQGEQEAPLTFGLRAETVGQSDPSPADNELAVARPLDSAADLAVSLAGLGTGTVGQAASYVLGYVNMGGQAAGATMVTLTLDPGLELVSAAPAPSATAVEGSRTILRWEVGDLAPGEGGHIVARVWDTTAAGEPALRAEVHGTAAENSGVNNLATLSAGAGLSPEDPMGLSARVALPLVGR